MSNPYVSVKLREDTVALIEEAKTTFLDHHPENDGINLTRNLIIKRALNYYIEN